MMRVLVLIGIAALIGLSAVGGGYFYVKSHATAPGPAPLDVNIVIESGQGVTAIAERLKAEGVIADPFVFKAWARLTERQRRLKAGEYLVPALSSIEEILDLLASGKTVVRKITIPEGITVTEALIIVQDAPGMKGTITAIPDEGWLMPETYFYKWNDERVDMILNMSAAMEDAVRRAWNERSEATILKSPLEMLTLASIVEKETAVPAERPMIAAVFLNRLSKGMKLQSDPTVVYALTSGAGALGRALTRDDLQVESPYNTYLNFGLPPGPIALVGQASLDAVIHPAQIDALYFVADGTGGHVFAKTLQEHNKNVAKWRQIKRDLKRQADENK